MGVVTAREAFLHVQGVQVKSDSPGWTTLCIPPDLRLKDQVVAFFRSLMRQDLPPELCEELGTAMDELMGNAIEHGSKSESHKGVEVTYIRTPRILLFQTRDAGPGFSLDGVNHAAVNNPPDNPLRHAEFRRQMGLRPGGFGIMPVKQDA